MTIRANSVFLVSKALAWRQTSVFCGVETAANEMKGSTKVGQLHPELPWWPAPPRQ